MIGNFRTRNVRNPTGFIWIQTTQELENFIGFKKNWNDCKILFLKFYSK